MVVPHFAHLFSYQWALGLFYLLAAVSDTAMNMGVQIPLQNLPVL